MKMCFLFAFSAYKIISTIAIYHETRGSFGPTIRQLFDVELYYTLFIAYKLGKQEKTSRQVFKT